MTDEAKKLRRDYYKAWHAKHPEKNGEYVRRYWQKKAQENAAAEQDPKEEGGNL